MRYTRNDAVIINCEEDNEIKYIAYNIDSGRIFIMNKSANEVFNLFSELNDLDKVIKTFETRYGKLSEEQKDSINEALHSMIEKELFCSAN